MAIWALSPLLLFIDPTMLGFFESPKNVSELLRHVGYIWFFVGVGGFLFRIAQLCVLQDITTALVWATKILTDPFHDIQLYHKSPLYLLCKPQSQVPEADDDEPEIDDEPAPAR
jgi:hypothetical protein